MRCKNSASAMLLWSLVVLLCFVTSRTQDVTLDDLFQEIEDDYNKVSVVCPEDMAECDNGECIPASSWCDEVRNCSDGSDEVNCDGYDTDSSPTVGSSGRDWTIIRIPGKDGEYVRYQFDIVIPIEEFEENFEIVNGTARRRKRAATTNDHLWTDRIPYEIDDNFNEAQKSMIKTAMQNWQAWSSTNFVHVTTEEHYISFIKNTKNLCHSLVGKQTYGSTTVYLGEACFKTLTVVQHEIGHALGLYHEHMRHDRDDYIIVHEENILPKKRNQFELLRQDYQVFGKPYDYLSLMHYGKNFFAREGLVSMEAKPPNQIFTNLMGKAPSPSFYDFQLLNSMQNSTAKCPRKMCPKGSFIGMHTCQCLCPTGIRERPVEACLDVCKNPRISGKTYEVDGGRIPLGDDVFLYQLRHLPDAFCGLHLTNVSCSPFGWNTAEAPQCITERCDEPVEWRERDWISDIMDDFRNGSKSHGFKMELFCDTTTTIKECDHGKWKGTPICSCVLDEKLRENYFSIDERGWKTNLPSEIPHDRKIRVTCKKTVSKSYILRCNDGNMEGLERLSCEKGCTLDDVLIKKYYSVDERGKRTALKTTIPHGSVIRVTCRNTISNTSRLICNDGTLEGHVPSNCQQETLPPVITSISNGTYYEIMEGMDIDISCQATGMPASYVDWFKVDTVAPFYIPSSGNVRQIKLAGRSDLTITGARTEDSGSYKCRALNTLGETACIVKVTIIPRSDCDLPEHSTKFIYKHVNGKTFRPGETVVNETIINVWCRVGDRRPTSLHCINRALIGTMPEHCLERCTDASRPFEWEVTDAAQGRELKRKRKISLSECMTLCKRHTRFCSSVKWGVKSGDCFILDNSTPSTTGPLKKNTEWIFATRRCWE